MRQSGIKLSQPELGRTRGGRRLASRLQEEESGSAPRLSRGEIVFEPLQGKEFISIIF